MKEKDYLYYGAYAPILEKKEKWILERLEEMLSSFATNESRSMAEHVLSRIKTADSMQEKLIRKGFENTDVKTALLNTSDCIGVRVVTHFIGDVYTIYDRIKEEDCWKIVKVKDYISNPKENGYRSLHVIIEIPVNEMGLETIRAELQLRTIAMDCWASLEHQMKYKKDIKNADLLVEELHRCADEMASTDLSMQTIREMIQEKV